MARKDKNPAAETIEEIDSFFDRIAERIANNPFPYAAALGTVLVVALIVSVANELRHGARLEASQAVGEVQTAFLEAMGAPLLTPRFSEPANPETARATRQEYAERLREVADEYSGTAAAAAGRIELGTLLSDLGDEEGARAAWQQAADEAPASSALRAAALFRLAVSLEASDMAEASNLYETAARIADYPASGGALAHAARTAAEAGQAERALALFAELEAEAGEGGRIPAPPFVTARLRELRAGQASSATE